MQEWNLLDLSGGGRIASGLAERMGTEQVEFGVGGRTMAIGTVPFGKREALLAPAQHARDAHALAMEAEELATEANLDRELLARRMAQLRANGGELGRDFVVRDGEIRWIETQ